ncbi:MAG: hypothetical protein PWQ20_330 [Thermotogaceae bacterium]|nr:hypothetical protein [Thermotogaceae bacterium]MDN5337260.1 hypothetical protein [Thermotogaceae bacterium]
MTVLIIFLTTLIVSYLRSIMSDRCLKDFEKYPVIVVLKNGKSIWGRIFIKSSGFLLRYDEPYNNVSHIEYGFIVYKNEYPTIFSIVRLLNILPEKELKKREKRKKFVILRPLIWVRKKFRNFFAAVRDAFVDTFSMLLGKASAKSSLISQNKKYVETLGANIIDYIGNSYDPILENLIDRKIVFEIFEDNEWKEYTGILKNYSKDFLEIFEAEFPLKVAIKIRNKHEKIVFFGIEIQNENNQIILKNNIKNSVKTCIGSSNYILEPGKEITIEQEIQVPIEITLEFLEKSDLILPRAIAVVRHLAEL